MDVLFWWQVYDDHFNDDLVEVASADCWSVLQGRCISWCWFVDADDDADDDAYADTYADAGNAVKVWHGQ